MAGSGSSTQKCSIFLRMLKNPGAKLVRPLPLRRGEKPSSMARRVYYLPKIRSLSWANFLKSLARLQFR